MDYLDTTEPQSKAKLRAYFKEKRGRFSESDVIQQSQRIAQLSITNIDFIQLETVHLFLPILSQNEVNTFFLIDLLRQAQPQLQIIVSRTLPKQVAMPTYLLELNTKLSTNKWGIPEPNEAQAFDSQLIDLVFVPMLCCDKQGFRVGYGKGFYDRFIEQCRPDIWKVGLSFFDPVGQISDLHSQDLQLDLVICPQKVYKFAAK